MAEHTVKNVEKLASEIVEEWDLDTLIQHVLTSDTLMQYAVADLTKHYMENEKEFHEKWSEFYNEGC